MRSTPPRRPSQPLSETRTSYHVGRPWMFDGKMLRGLTGTPMRRIDLAKSVFADAEPEPFTLANLTTKSLTASRCMSPVFGSNDAKSLTREERPGTLGEAGSGVRLMLLERGGLVETEAAPQLEEAPRLPPEV